MGFNLGFLIIYLIKIYNVFFFFYKFSKFFKFRGIFWGENYIIFSRFDFGRIYS